MALIRGLDVPSPGRRDPHYRALTMSRFAVLALYPLWAVAMVVATTALRLGRASRRGLLSLCFSLAFWVTGLILLENPGTAGLAERVVPAGAFLAAAFVHAGADVARLERRAVVWLAYLGSAVLAATGAIAPRLLYGPGARSAGPLFVPVAIVSAAASLSLFVWLARTALTRGGGERRRLGAIAIACALGSLGGGGVVMLRVLGLGDVGLAAPLLLPAVGLAAYAVLSAEEGRSRGVVIQGVAYAVLTAALSSIGLTVFFRVLPVLTPGAGSSLPWLILVTFLASLPLDPVRMIVVEKAGRLLFKNPIGVRDLEDRIARTEVRADHAERLAEIGRLASAVAHEIRNPLGVIAAQAKLLERQGAKPETVAAMRGQIDRARKFLDDLLRYSRPRPLELHEIEVLPTLQLVAGNVRQILGESAPAIDAAITGGAAIYLEVDRGAFTDVATVLASNAAMALDGAEGGRVTITASRESGAVIVRVEDNGPGVPAEIEATLFEPFVTGRGRDARHPGTGLGLAIAARWVERHGGSIKHERPREGGARFVVRWPEGAAGREASGA
jgi:signal transduction histidine kinase